MATVWMCDEARDEVAALLVLVPDRSRSRAGSYGEIEAATAPTSTNSARPAVETTSTTATPTGSRSRRQQERMQRRRVWRKRHDE